MRRKATRIMQVDFSELTPSWKFTPYALEPSNDFGPIVCDSIAAPIVIRPHGHASTKTMLAKRLADAPAPIAQELAPVGELADEIGRLMERSPIARLAQLPQPASNPTERSLERTVTFPLLTGAQSHLSSPADIGGAEAG